MLLRFCCLLNKINVSYLKNRIPCLIFSIRMPCPLLSQISYFQSGLKLICHFFMSPAKSSSIFSELKHSHTRKEKIQMSDWYKHLQTTSFEILRNMNCVSSVKTNNSTPALALNKCWIKMSSTSDSSERMKKNLSY